MKNRIFKAIAGFLVAALAITAVPAISAQAAKGNNGPLKDDYEIGIWDVKKEEGCGIANSWNDVTKVKGITYNKKTNTLTLNNYKNDNVELNVNRMGDDFTINVVGTNNLRCISVFGDWAQWGGSLKITGNGTLNINKKNEDTCAICLDGGFKSTNPLSLVVDGTVSLNLGAYKNEEGNLNDAIYAHNAGKITISVPGLTLNKKNSESGQQQDYERVFYIEKQTLNVATAYDTRITGDLAVNEWGEIYYIKKVADGTYAIPTWRTENPVDFDQIEKTDKTIEVDVCAWTEDWDKIIKDGKDYFCRWDNGLKIYDTIQIEGVDGFIPKLIETISDDDPDVDAKWEAYDAAYKSVMLDGVNWIAVRAKINAPAIAKATISKVTAGKASATVVAKAVKGAAGYEVRYATAKNMKGAKTVAGKKATVKVSKLTSGKTYYVQVRAMKKTSSGAKAYGDWSAVQTVVAQ